MCSEAVLYTVSFSRRFVAVVLQKKNRCLNSRCRSASVAVCIAIQTRRMPMSNAQFLMVNRKRARAHAQLSSHITFISLEFFEIHWAKCITMFRGQKKNHAHETKRTEIGIDTLYYHSNGDQWRLSEQITHMERQRE